MSVPSFLLAVPQNPNAPLSPASFDNHVRYGALFLLVPGAFGGGPPLGTWAANNASPLARRATAIALITTMTNIGSIFATWLFGTVSPAPRYDKATATLLGFQVAIAVCAAVNIVYLAGRNAAKAQARVAETEKGKKEDMLVVGDESIWFEYVL